MGLWTRGGRLRPVVVADLVLAAVIVVQVVLLVRPRGGGRKEPPRKAEMPPATPRPGGWAWEEVAVAGLPPADGAYTVALPAPSGRRLLLLSESGTAAVYDAAKRTVTRLELPAGLDGPSGGVRGGEVFVHDRSGQVLLLGGLSGRVRQAVPPAAMRSSAGVRLFRAAKGLALTGIDGLNRAVAMDLKAGVPIWSYADASDTVMAAAVPFRRGWRKADGLVLVAQDGTAVALDGASGWALWRMPLQERVVLPAWTGDLWGGREEEILVLGQTKAFGLAPDGRLLWALDLPTEPTGEVASADLDGDRRREVLLVCGDGSVVAVDAAGRMRTLLERRGPEAWPADLAVVEARKGKRRLRLVLALYGDGLVRVAEPSGEAKGWTMPVQPGAGWVRLGRRLVYVGRDGVLREGRAVWR